MDENILEEMKQYYWYHCIELKKGTITDGDYDFTNLIQHYGFPENMHGMSVLDVGRASGFFAFEFEKRGADVTAVDIASFFDWDFVGGEQAKEARKKSVLDEKEFSEQHIYGAFEYARKIKGSKVKSKFINVYDLSPDAFDGEKFDLVFAGSITSHLRDPILALERLHSVTKKQCIVSFPIFKRSEVGNLPLMLLVGTMDSDRRSWWVVNNTCAIEMMKCANFQDIQIISAFNLQNRRVNSLSVPHLVVHGHAS